MGDLIVGLALMAATGVALYARSRDRGARPLGSAVWAVLGALIAPIVWLVWLASWLSRRHRPA